jgi:putative ATP-binding cassette transporter
LETDDLSWNKKLSPGEKQRLAFARCILLKPDYLFLDEATSAMDQDLEAKVFKVLTERLKDAAIISVAHRESMSEYHDNVLNILGQQ